MSEEDLNNYENDMQNLQRYDYEDYETWQMDARVKFWKWVRDGHRELTHEERIERELKRIRNIYK